jgi:glycosyltransferase involved in cell wall biosynthesis
LAFVSPSLAEGFNLPLLEAAACETPILASDIPIHHEVLGGNALFFDPHSVESLGKALEKVILDGTERERLRRGAVHLHQKYSWKKAARETLEVYKNLL